jgi:hypothetical protein
MDNYKYIEEEEEEEEGGEPSKIKVGDQEYTMDELSALVADGQFKREVETKQNTKLDKVMGEYTKLTQERSGWESERDEYLRLKAEREKMQNPQPQGGFTPEQIEQARKDARTLGLFTKEDVEEYVSQNFPKYYVQQREADKMLEKMEKYQVEIDGSDGRPKFNMDEVLEHIKQTGIKDPLKAYKDKYEADLDAWKEKQLLGSKREGLRTETQSTAGGKTPPEVKITRDNVGKLMSEALHGGGN